MRFCLPSQRVNVAFVVYRILYLRLWFPSLFTFFVLWSGITFPLVVLDKNLGVQLIILECFEISFERNL